MAYDFKTGGGNFASATELVTSIYDQVDSAFVDTLYPEILWKTIIPQQSVKTDIDPGAMNYVYRTRDMKGTGAFVNGSSKNIPRVGQVVGQVVVPILEAAIGAELTNMEARRYSYGMQGALAQDFGEIMKRGAEYHVERSFFFGNNQAGFAPFLDYPTVSKIPAADAWANLTPKEWVQEINDAITSVWLASKTVHLPDTVFLPPGKFSMLQAPMVIGDGNVGIATNALEYLKKNNIYTGTTGKELTVLPLRYLTGAGVAGVDRAVIGEWNPRNFVMPFPLAYQLAQPVPVALGVEMFAEYIFGSFHVKFPGAMAYLDGI
jgi:hypothetical protein